MRNVDGRRSLKKSKFATCVSQIIRFRSIEKEKK